MANKKLFCHRIAPALDMAFADNDPPRSAQSVNDNYRSGTPTTMPPKQPTITASGVSRHGAGFALYACLASPDTLSSITSVYLFLSTNGPLMGHRPQFPTP
jgi:hypothetical protein